MGGGGGGRCRNASGRISWNLGRLIGRFIDDVTAAAE